MVDMQLSKSFNSSFLNIREPFYNVFYLNDTHYNLLLTTIEVFCLKVVIRGWCTVTMHEYKPPSSGFILFKYKVSETQTQLQPGPKMWLLFFVWGK